VSRNNFQNIITFTLLATSSYDVDFNLGSIDKMTTLIVVSAASSTNPANLTLTIFDGFGGDDSTATGNIPIVAGGSNVPTYNTTGTIMPLNPVVTNTNTPQTISTSIYYRIREMSNWSKHRFTNTDTQYPRTVQILADI